jgi:flagellar hook-length control protein FliK
VRDLIETGLYQLKSDLQNQGLQVDRLEVAMSNDQRQHGWQSGPNPQAWKAPGDGFGADDREPAEERRAAVVPPSRWSGSASIDMFV